LGKISEYGSKRRVFVKQGTYIRCPRCELNFIQKKDKFCNVCKGEMSVGNELIDFDLDFDICPVCKTNYVTSEESVCVNCAREKALEEAQDENTEGNWKTHIGDDEEEDEGEGDGTESLTISDFEEEEEEDLIIPASIEEDFAEEFSDDENEADDDESENEEDDFEDIDDIDADDDDDDDDDY